MQIHEIQREHKNETKKRIGRGGKRGTYSGKGMKGQRQHGGRAPRPEMRDIIKKIPKLRGYRFHSIQKDFYVANISVLNDVFNNGETVTPKILIEKKIIRVKKGEHLKIKILGNGSLDKKLTIQGCFVSASAQNKIEKAGGTVVLPKKKEIKKKA